MKEVKEIIVGSNLDIPRGCYLIYDAELKGKVTSLKPPEYIVTKPGDWIFAYAIMETLEHPLIIKNPKDMKEF